MQVTTKRLVIRPFKEGDADALYSYTSNAKTMHYLPEEPFTRQDVACFIATKNEAYAVVLQESNALIGHIVFERYFGNHSYEIGWVFHQDYCGKGYATEAAAAVLTYGFEEMGLHRVVATCQPENHASYRIMEKLGMRREGLFLQCIPYHDTWWDEYSYAILQQEYYEKKQRLS